MQISLDYYRILSVPIQAELSLIQQAYEDRIVQLPHHNYTEYAIASRKELVTKAYQILSDEQARLDYESSFFQNPQETPVATGEVFREVSITIDDHLLLGSLIILLDLGEYELILRICQPYLQDKIKAKKLARSQAQFNLLWQDLILTVVLAHLELAREKWHEQEYDSAADSLKQSYQLLSKERLFANICKEVKQDLAKLRPYQILELLTQNQVDLEMRNKGIYLLKEMLNSRGGMESKQIDESGLNIDGFLRFIQQIRVYLTVEEQQKLFEQETKRPSSAAAYLCASACIARGVNQKNPELIVQAKNYLISLTLQQDVYLEQAICALLLGQTAEAEFSLTQSKEEEIIQYIKELSENSPDLLPGLFVYSEKWLQTEVFPQFKDLRNTSVSLQEYFTNDSVQKYLDNLSPPLQTDNNDEPADLEFPRLEIDNSLSLLSNQDDEQTILISKTEVQSSDNNSEFDQQSIALNDENITFIQQQQQNDDRVIITKVNDNQPEKEEDLIVFEDFLSADMTFEKSASGELEVSSLTTNETVTPTNDENQTQVTTTSKSVEKKATSNDKSNNYNSWKIGDKLIVSMLVALVSLIVLLLLGFLAWQAWSKIKNNDQEAENLTISLSQPIVNFPIPPDVLTPVSPNQNLPTILNNNTALNIVNQWLEAKTQATGPDYDFTKLNQILTEPQLSLWLVNSKALQADKAYRRYEHEVEILSAKTNPQNETKGKIQARVKEKSQYYVNDTLLANSSYEDNLVVEYNLVQQTNKWLIQEIQVIKTN